MAGTASAVESRPTLQAAEAIPSRGENLPRPKHAPREEMAKRERPAALGITARSRSAPEGRGRKTEAGTVDSAEKNTVPFLLSCLPHGGFLGKHFQFEIGMPPRTTPRAVKRAQGRPPLG